MPDPETDLGDSSPAEQETPLEEKYRAQMRQIMPQKIELPISTLPSMIKEQIDLSPGFQRRNRWDDERRSRFIESIIMNVPIPPVFLGEDEYGKYVVLDGRQRLTAVNEFMKNTYRLKKLEVWNELNGLTFDDLQKRKLDRFFTRRFIPAIVILKESSPVVKYDVFDRLNTGGMVAVPMEIRNAIYQGPFTDSLHRLSKQELFRRLWDIPIDNITVEKNKTYAEMQDLELVLRFFALHDPARMNLNFKDYLSDFMEVRNHEYVGNKNLETQDTQLFVAAITNAWRVFGAEAFRKPDETRQLTSSKSAPLADAVTIALSEVRPDRIDDRTAGALRNAFIDLCLVDDFKKAITAGTNGKGAITTRVQMARETVRRTI